MKKPFILGLLIALFVLSIPAYADPHPGGPAVASMSTADSFTADVAMIETQAVTQSFAVVTDQLAIKEAVKTVAGFVSGIAGALLIAVLVAPFVTMKRRQKYDSSKRTKSPVLKHLSVA